jgi:hypothetical protein
MITGKFRPLAYNVLVISVAFLISVLFYQRAIHNCNIRESIDWGGVVFFFLITLLAELLSFLIFRFFSRLVNYLSNFYVALLVCILSPGIILAALMFVHQH